jgi:YVTN family beta-propeller protein
MLALGGPKQRAVLAMLLLDANEVVSRDRLVDGLWGERPPATAARNVESYVSRLRTILGAERIQRRAPGYVLRTEPGEVDLDRFEALVEEGRAHASAGDAPAASRHLHDALNLWRGTALADLADEPFAPVEVGRLEERRLLAVEERIGPDIALGKNAELVPELEALIREHPFRERLVAQLMLALYRSGRQADALAVFQSGRRRLAEELGLEPGPELQALQRRILEHDPALGGSLKATSGPRPLSTRHRKRLIAVGLASAVVGLGVSLGVLVGTSGTSASRSAAEANRVVGLGSPSRSSSAGIPLEGTPTAMAAAEGSLWLADPSADAVIRLDLDDPAVVDRVPVANPGALTIGAGAVWAARIPGDTVVRIDRDTGTVTQSIPLGRARVAALTYGAGSLWIADVTDNSLISVDPSSGRLRRELPLDVRPTALAAGKGAIWVADYDAGTIAEVDARTGRTVATVGVGNGPAALAVGLGSTWVANSLDSTVSRIEPGTSKVSATIAVGSGPSAIAVAGDAVWVASEYGESVSRIDPQRNVVAETITLEGGPTVLAVAGGEVWAGLRPLLQERGGTAVLLHTRPIIVDPALHADLLPPVSDGLTRDGLVTYNHVAGPAGTHLVPDLALAIPRPTDAGRTYTFRVRPGIRYSDGRLVHAADFRRALERVFNLRSYGASLFSSLVGAEACGQESSSSCDLSRGIVTDEASRTVAFRLRSPDPAFLTNLASAGLATAVPEGTPMRRRSDEPIPGTGPYMIASASASLIRYVRNPRFREWSHAAQPDGNPDEIVMRFLPPTEEVRAVLEGRADWMTEAIPGTLLPDLARRFPGQLHSNANPVVQFFQLNTKLSPFDDIRARRALSLAVDRAAFVKRLGGKLAASPTCQVLPPGVRGYRRYCPYTLRPRADGLWTAPDLRRAQRLVTASGTAGTDVAVWGITDDPALGPAAARDIADVLRRLGYRTRLCLVPSSFSRIPRGCDPAKIQLGPAGWGGPFAYEFFGPWISCEGSNSRGFCDRRIDARIRRAQTLEATDPRAAAVLWQRIDRDVSDLALWVPLVNSRVIDFVSARVRNYQYHPYWGFLADQMVIR